MTPLYAAVEFLQIFRFFQVAVYEYCHELNKKQAMFLIFEISTVAAILLWTENILSTYEY